VRAEGEMKPTPHDDEHLKSMVVLSRGVQDPTLYQYSPDTIAEPETTVAAEYSATKCVVAVDLCTYRVG
jgi:hypothetical protein